MDQQKYERYFKDTIVEKTIIKRSLGYEFITTNIKGAVMKGVHEFVREDRSLNPFNLPEFTIILHPDLFTRLHILYYDNEHLGFWEWLTMNLKITQILQDLRIGGNIFRIEYKDYFFDIIIKPIFLIK